MDIDPYDPPSYGGTPIQEAMEEQRQIFGMENPDQEWILTSWDVWVLNPYYNGPAGRHPEDDRDDYEDDNFYPEEDYMESYPEEFEDDIPF